MWPLTQNNWSWSHSFFFAKPSVSRGVPVKVISMLMGSIWVFLCFPFSLHCLLLSSPAALSAVAFLNLPPYPRTQSFCYCLATLPFTSEPLFTSFSLSSPALPLSLSSLINGVAGLWAAHPQQGVASHCKLSPIIVCICLFFSFPLWTAFLFWLILENSPLNSDLSISI